MIHNLNKVFNSWMEGVTGMTATNQNRIHENIKSRLNLGNACFHTVQKLPA
jgi:hypothetical protein